MKSLISGVLSEQFISYLSSLCKLDITELFALERLAEDQWENHCFLLRWKIELTTELSNFELFLKILQRKKSGLRYQIEMCQYTNGKWFSVCVAHKTALKTNSFDEKPVFDCTK